MESDLKSTSWICEKVRTSNIYAQNLYAALCNNEFQKKEMWPILKDERWSCSWRHAGAIIADMKENGDYLDWYCSGIRTSESWDQRGYSHEGDVTEEIKYDLHRLGWMVIEDQFYE